MDKIKFHKTIDKLYLSFSVVFFIFVVILGYIETINKDLENNRRYQAAHDTYSFLKDDKVKNNGFSPTAFLANQSIEKEPCFTYFGQLQQMDSSDYCYYKIENFHKKNIFLSCLIYLSIVLGTVVMLYLFRKWIIWLFKHKES